MDECMDGWMGGRMYVCLARVCVCLDGSNSMT